MKNIIIVPVLALLLVGCAALSNKNEPISAYKPESSQAAQDRHDAMLGNWVGEAPVKEGESRKWLIHRSANGTYLVTFITEKKNEQPNISQEVGFWGISGPIYFTMTRGWMRPNRTIRPADPSKAYFYDAYKIIALSEKSFEYESLAEAGHFEVRKVSADYTVKDLLDSFDKKR